MTSQTIHPTPQIIHEYLAANGLAGAADALAVEAGINPRHPLPQTPGLGGGSRLLGPAGGTGASLGVAPAAAAAAVAAVAAAGSSRPGSLSRSSSVGGGGSRRRDAGGPIGGGGSGHDGHSGVLSCTASAGDKRSARGVKRLSFSAAASGAAAAGGAKARGGSSSIRTSQTASESRAAPLLSSTSEGSQQEGGQEEKGDGLERAAAKRPRLLATSVAASEHAAATSSVVMAGTNADGGNGGEARVDDSAARAGQARDHRSRKINSSGGAGDGGVLPRPAAAISSVPINRPGRIASAFSSPSYFGAPLRPGTGKGRAAAAVTGAVARAGGKGHKHAASGGGKRSARTPLASPPARAAVAAAATGGSASGLPEQDGWAATPVGTPRGFYTAVASSSSIGGGGGSSSSGIDDASFNVFGSQNDTREGKGSGGGGSCYSSAGKSLELAPRSFPHHHQHVHGGGIGLGIGALSRDHRGATAGTAAGGGGGAAVEGTTALDKIVTSFLRNQHERCPDPVCVLPPLSLSEPHRCPGRAPEGAMGAGAPPNVAKRALAWQVCVNDSAAGLCVCVRGLLFVYVSLATIAPTG